MAFDFLKKGKKNEKVSDRRLKRQVREAKKKETKSSWQEWKETIVFALIVVPLLNIFVLQSYAIPTSSMEGSMLVGDKLFVSKFHYGVKIPNTPLALPFMHNRIWGTNMKSYTDLIKLPDWRLPAFEGIDSGDICVFNWPVGDTMTTKYLSTRSYYDLLRNEGRKNVERKYDLVLSPTDRKENYVKRCVAAAGDKLEIVDGTIYINDVPFKDHENVQHMYFVTTTGQAISKKKMQELNIREVFKMRGGPNTWGIMMNKETAEKVRGFKKVLEVKKRLSEKGERDENLYPHNDKFAWSIDNYGPLYMPKEGDTLPMTEENYILYERPIRVYENNPSFTWKDGKAYLKGQAIDEYTFQMDYHYMIGDNRHNSQDSRAWGFVPKNHISGKPIFVWMSTYPPGTGSGWINWKKCFRLIR